jgi:rfaE bifunctional protein kinase chain/domain
MLTEAFVAALKSARVAVIGDVMVDHYVYGAVQRISPEAPVPVLHVAGERYVLGGAANVAANIAALGGFARLCGIVGEDPAADRLRALIADLVAIEPDMAASPTHATIIKTRYLGDRQQIVRVDREVRAPHGAETIADLTQRVAAAIAACSRDKVTSAAPLAFSAGSTESTSPDPMTNRSGSANTTGADEQLAMRGEARMREFESLS